MFDNIGRKIKVLAKVLCWFGITVSAIGTIALWCANSYYQPTIVLGFIVLIVGSAGSWLGSLFTYGFGELIDHAASIDEKLTSQSFYLHNLSDDLSTIMRSSALPIENAKQNSAQTPNEVNKPSENSVKTSTSSNASTRAHKLNTFSASELQALKKMHEEGNLSEEEYQACLAYKDE